MFLFQSNRQQLFLQGADSVYLNTGDVMLQTTQGAMLDGNGNGMNSPSMHFSNKHWQTFQLPPHYVTSNWPIRVREIFILLFAFEMRRNVFFNI